MSTRLFNNVKALTSTKATSSELIEEEKITQVCLVMYFTWEISEGKVSLPDDDSKFVRCSSCKMKMSNKSLQKSINGTFCFPSGYVKVKLSIFSSTLFTMAIANQLSVDDVESIEDFLLSNYFMVSFSNEAKRVQNIIHLANVKIFF